MARRTYIRRIGQKDRHRPGSFKMGRGRPVKPQKLRTVEDKVYRSGTKTDKDTPDEEEEL